MALGPGPDRLWLAAVAYTPEGRRGVVRPFLAHAYRPLAWHEFEATAVVLLEHGPPSSGGGAGR